MRIFQLVFFFILSSISYVNAQDTHTNEECEAFVVIYMGQKLFTPSSTVSIESLLTRYQVSKPRYAELVSPVDYYNVSDMSPNEKRLIEAIKKENDTLAKQKNEMVRSACHETVLSYEKYQKIMYAYQTDISFQRSLKPYFDQYFNRRK